MKVLSILQDVQNLMQVLFSSCHFYLYVPFCSCWKFKRIVLWKQLPSNWQVTFQNYAQQSVLQYFYIRLSSCNILYLGRTSAFAAWFLACFTSIHLSFKLHLCVRSSLNAVNVWSFEMQTNWLTQTGCVSCTEKSCVLRAGKSLAMKFQGIRHSH